MILLIGICCSNEDINSDKDNLKGKMVFFTNAQALLYCGSFNVDIYIDSVLTGSIPKGKLIDSLDLCTESNYTLLIEKNEGHYEYYARANCGDYGTWSGTVDILPDSCQKIFLDVSELFINKNKLAGTWIEKYPEKFDGISDTLLFDGDMHVRKYFCFDGWKYFVINDTITFYLDANIETFLISHSDENEIVIYNFLDRSISSEIKDIHFIKINLLLSNEQIITKHKLIGEWFEISPCDSCYTLTILESDTIYLTTKWNDPIEKVPYFIISKDSIKVEREIDLVKQVTKHQLIFHADDKIELKVFRPSDANYLYPFEDIILLKK